MRIRKKLIVMISFILLTLAFLILLPQGRKGEKDYYNISVILRNKNSEGLKIIKDGMEQAASESNINLNYITLIKDNDIENQKEVIIKEIEKGVDALVISPADYDKLTGYIEEINKKVPVILFDSNINTNQDINYVSCDSYYLGKRLAEEVIRNGNTRKKINILKSDLNSSSVNEMIAGFLEEIDNTNKEYEILELSNDEEIMNSEIENLLKEKNEKVIITFEQNILEILGKNKKTYINKDIKLNKDNEIYGTGSSSLVISLIEEDIINGIAMRNEFNLGYITLKTLMSKIEDKKVSYGTIDSTIINSDNMYSKHNQRILFPITR